MGNEEMQDKVKRSISDMIDESTKHLPMNGSIRKTLKDVCFAMYREGWKECCKLNKRAVEEFEVAFDEEVQKTD